MSQYKLGRLAPKPVLGLGDLTHYLSEPLPVPPPSVTAPKLTYPMAGNDQYGDCTIAAAVHADQATASLDKEPWKYPGDQAVVDEYLKLTGGADTGLVETNVLSTWTTDGLFGNRLAAWAPINVKHTQVLKQTVALCGVAYTGVMIPAPAQSQFAAGQPWDLTGTSADSDIEGGHAVPAVGYDPEGVWFVTWGALQLATWRWVAAYLEESYALITAEVERRGGIRGVNLAALKDDLLPLLAKA